MGSICKSICVVDDVSRVHPRRATSYANLHTWPESDKEFLKSVSLRRSNQDQGLMMNGPPRVLDSISCRSMYIRSYTFTTEKKKKKKKETVSEKTKRCFGRVKDKVVLVTKKGAGVGIMRKVETSLCSLFHKLLSCSASVDVVDHHHHHHDHHHDHHDHLSSRIF